MGNLSYLARESRPDLAGPTAFLQCRFPGILVSDLLEINRITALAVRFADLSILVHPLLPDRVCILTFVDAAHQNATGGASQGGHLSAFADRSVIEGKMADISPCLWRSRRLRRKAASSTHSEVMAISEGLAAGEYMRCLWLAATRPDYDVARPYHLCDACPQLSVTDSKSGFDHLTHPTSGPSQDRRCAVDVSMVRAALRLPSTFLRWVDGARQQLTDAITKKAGNADLLRAVLQAGRFQIT